MKELPIIFSSPMVRAILNGSKTMTRRVINPQPTFVSGGWHWAHKSYDNGDGAHYFHTDEECAKRLLLKAGIAPKAGEKRWVKETFRLWDYDFEGVEVDFQATTPECGKYVAMNPKPTGLHKRRKDGVLQWKPSIFMPRWASRITLEITGVRVERLQEISEEDAMAEGIQAFTFDVPPNPPNQTIVQYGTINYFPKTEVTSCKAFGRLWDSIQLQRAVPKGAFAWSANPWVYVIAFKRVQP